MRHQNENSMISAKKHDKHRSGDNEKEFPIPMPVKFCRFYASPEDALNQHRYFKNLPADIETRINEAIVALAECQGLNQNHISTIVFCIKYCPNKFESAYTSYFELLTSNTPRWNLEI